jgi:hypothetical protein
MSTIWTGLLLSSVLLGGCVSAIPLPTEQDTEVGLRTYPGLTTEELARGRKLYVAKCAGCHTLFLPSDRPAAAWPMLVEQMSERASLTGSERGSIERYLATIARRSNR